MENATCPDESWSKNNQNNIMYIIQDLDIYAYLKMLFSVIGSILNLAILTVFVLDAKKFNTRFDKFLRNHSCVSLMVLIVLFIKSFTACGLLTETGFYMRLMFSLVTYIMQSFCHILDTYMIYERIQIYNPKLKFLSKTSTFKLTFLIIILAILENLNEIPLLMNRYSVIIQKCNGTETEFKNFIFLNNRYYEIFCYFLLYFEFLLKLIIDLILNVYLLKKMRLLHMKISDTSDIKNKVTERNNTIIAIVLCLISSCLTIVSFMHDFFKIKSNLLVDGLNVSLLAFKLFDFVLIFKYSLNFFLFYFLNKKFRESVNRLGRLFSCHKNYMI